MAWKKSIHRQLAALIRDGSIEEFRRMLTSYPDNLRMEDGRDYLLWSATASGQLEFVKLLIEEFGIGTEETRDPAFPTALINAISRGHHDIAMWLIDHGAELNSTIDGRRNCPALKMAAQAGDLELVKRLVERGAGVNAAGATGVNAYMLAKTDEIREFLRSAGGVDLRQTTPQEIVPDYQSAHECIMAEMEDYAEDEEQWGQLLDWQMAFSGNPVIKLYAMGAAYAGETLRLFTVGMSDVPLKDSDIEQGYGVELMAFLSSDWELNKNVKTDPQRNWPMLAIEKLARQIIEKGALGIQRNSKKNTYAITEWNGDSPEPIAPETNLCGWLLIDSGHRFMPDSRMVWFLSAVPFYREELELVRQAGDCNLLLSRFRKLGITREMAFDRPNAITDWKDEYPDFEVDGGEYEV